MKTIALTKNQLTIVDDEDYAMLSKIRWCVINGTNASYAGRDHKINGKYKTILMHRVIMKAKRGQIVDHINRNTLDNRKENLRFCTASESVQNRGMHKNNSVGFKGVHLNKKLMKFEAWITKDHVNYYLGIFKEAEAAGKAYARAAQKLHGNFAPISTKS